ncbi:MAG: hypothetical protein QM784_40305 [Polyangiaceae bacterium]
MVSRFQQHSQLVFQSRLIARATEEIRAQPTTSEATLWSQIRGGRLGGCVPSPGAYRSLHR